MAPATITAYSRKVRRRMQFSVVDSLSALRIRGWSQVQFLASALSRRGRGQPRGCSLSSLAATSCTPQGGIERNGDYLLLDRFYLTCFNGSTLTGAPHVQSQKVFANP